MDDRRAANERPEKSHHEIDRMIRQQNAEVAISGRKGIQRGERDALLEIVVVRHHTALRPAAGAGRVDDRRDIAPCARRKNWLLRLRLRIFPTLRAVEIRLRWG